MTKIRKSKVSTANVLAALQNKNRVVIVEVCGSIIIHKDPEGFYLAELKRPEAFDLLNADEAVLKTDEDLDGWLYQAYRRLRTAESKLTDRGYDFYKIWTEVWDNDATDVWTALRVPTFPEHTYVEQFITNNPSDIVYPYSITGVDSEPAPAPMPEPEPEPAPVPVPAPKPEPKKVTLELEERAPKMGLEDMIYHTVKQAVVSDFTDTLITDCIYAKLDEYGIKPNVKTIEVIDTKGERRDVGVQHNKFEAVLKALSARVNIALVGPAGSGKTTCAMNAAKALGLRFASISVSSETGVHEFFGYKNAHGESVTTLFQDFYTNGGVFLIDEFDAGSPNVLAATNQATANNVCHFVDGMKEKHEDFMVVMAGNTWGSGANEDYVGRNPIDAATLDRFVQIYFPIDEALETELCSNKMWCKMVQDIRKRADLKGVRAIISPRATFMGERLLKAGLSVEDVLEYTIFKGLSKDEVNLIK